MTGTHCRVVGAEETEPCDVALGDGTVCCERHAGELVLMLADVPDLLADLDVTLSRQDRLGVPGRSGETVLMWKKAVPAAVFALGNSVTTWARLIADRNHTTVGAGATYRRPIRGSRLDVTPTNGHRRRPGPRCDETGLRVLECAHCRGLGHVDAVLPDDAVHAVGGLHRTDDDDSDPVPVAVPRAHALPAAPVLGHVPPSARDGLVLASRWLVRNIGLLRHDVEAPEAHGEITRAVTAARQACSAPPLRLYVGRCLCGEDLYCRPDFQSETCPRCSAVHDDMQARYHLALRKVKLWPATAAVIARDVGALYDVHVDRMKINYWHQQGDIAPVDHDDAGNPRFRIGAVLERARLGDKRRKENRS